MTEHALIMCREPGRHSTQELKGFQKVFLQPGETQDVTITINKDALSFYDEATSAWKAEAGDFEALIGTASDNLTQKVKFTLK